MSRVQSVQRAFAIMKQLASGEMGVTALAAAVELPKSTVARLLKTLQAEGAVEQDPQTGSYHIGQGLASLARSTGSTDLVARVRPHLVALAAETGEDAGLSVPDGHRVHYIYHLDSQHSVQVRDWTGDLAPMNVVPSGLVILAHWPEDALEEYLERPLSSFTEASMTDPDDLRKRLDRIRRAGFAWGFEEYAEGINSVAAPLLDRRGRPRAAITVSGPSYRFPPDGEMEAISSLVVERARLISDQLESGRKR